MIYSIATEKVTQFDDVIITDYIDTNHGSYNLDRWYIGGLDDEGNEDLTGACGCQISLYEVDAKDEHKAINNLISILTKQGYEVNTSEEVTMVCAPRIHKSLSIDNYDSESTTEKIIATIKDYFRA